MVCKLEMIFVWAGLLKSKLPFHILKDMDSACNNEIRAQIFKRMEFLIVKLLQKVF
jgi:hypothetical protein